MPMNLRFGRAKRKTPKELIARTNDALTNVNPGNPGRSSGKAVEDVGRYLEQIKVCLLDHTDDPADREYVYQLNAESIQLDLVRRLLNKLQALEFETRKDAGLVIATFLKIKAEDGTYPMAEYIGANFQILRLLADAYRDPNDAHFGLISGAILRDCIKHEKLAKSIAESNLCLQFVDDILMSKFEIGADALCTFRELLTKHKDLMAEILCRRYEEVIPQIHRLIQSDNFFIKRQSLKLLNDILLEPKNNQVVAKYVRNVQHLIRLMNLLRDPYDSIQFEAYHSFKVFLIGGGSDGGPEVLEILRSNKQKLLRFMNNFQSDKAEVDEEFREDRDYACQLIQQIPD